MTRPLSSRKSWQSNNAGCTSKNFNGLVFDIFKLVHFHLLWHSKGTASTIKWNISVGIRLRFHFPPSMFQSLHFHSAFFMDLPLPLLLSIVLCSSRASWTLTNEHQVGGISQQQVWANLNWSGSHCFEGGRLMSSSSLRVVCVVCKALFWGTICWRVNIPERSGYLRRMEWIAFRCDWPWTVASAKSPWGK